MSPDGLPDNLNLLYNPNDPHNKSLRGVQNAFHGTRPPAGNQNGWRQVPRVVETPNGQKMQTDVRVKRNAINTLLGTGPSMSVQVLQNGEWVDVTDPQQLDQISQQIDQAQQVAGRFSTPGDFEQAYASSNGMVSTILGGSPQGLAQSQQQAQDQLRNGNVVTNSKGVKYVQVDSLGRAVTANDVNALGASEVAATFRSLFGSAAQQVDTRDWRQVQKARAEILQKLQG